MFVLALCIPEAFDDGAGGLDGPLVLAAGLPGRPGDALPDVLAGRPRGPGLRGQLTRFAPDRGRQQRRADRRLADRGRRPRPRCGRSPWSPTTSAPGSAAPRAGGCPSPGHFSERHGLIVIIALGESIVAIGVGVADAADHLADPRSPPLLGLLARLGDVVGLLRRQRPGRRAGPGRRARRDPARLARTAYTFAHMPLIVGDRGRSPRAQEGPGVRRRHRAPRPGRPAQGRGARRAGRAASSLYLLAHVVFKWVVSHRSRSSGWRPGAASALASPSRCSPSGRRCGQVAALASSRWSPAVGRGSPGGRGDRSFAEQARRTIRDDASLHH